MGRVSLLALLALPASSAVKPFAFYGEMHTGTHYLNHVLRLNYVEPTGSAAGDKAARDAIGDCSLRGDCYYGTQCAFDTLSAEFCCWKHGYADGRCAKGAFSPAAELFVTVERDPYAWLVAMAHQQYEHDGFVSNVLSEFIRGPLSYCPVIYYEALGANCPHDKRATPVERWVAKVRALRAAQHHVTTAQLSVPELYNSTALEAKVDGPMRALGYARRDEASFLLPLNDNGVDDKWSGQFSRSVFEEARRYEDEREWQSLFTPDDVEFIQRSLPADLARDYRWTPGKHFLQAANSEQEALKGGSGALGPAALTWRARHGALTERQRRLHNFLDGGMS